MASVRDNFRLNAHTTPIYYGVQLVLEATLTKFLSRVSSCFIVGFVLCFRMLMQSFLFFFSQVLHIRCLCRCEIVQNLICLAALPS